MEALIPVVVGFVLTTVVGGFLGSVFQRRSWNHQHSVQVMEQERERATQVFEELSRLMDKRLYRLRLLYWSLPAEPVAGGRTALSESRMDDYRQVLCEWNDGINRYLALLQRYFGESVRRKLDNEVGSSFVELGRKVEQLWKANEKSIDLDGRLKALSSQVYGFNIEMIRTIQAKSIEMPPANLRRRSTTN
jgi:hypothetical protein